MGVAIYVVLKEKLPAARAIAMDGKMLARAADALAVWAKQHQVTPLEEFFSADPGGVADLLGLDPEAATEFPAERWFSPGDGLATVGALLEALRTGDAQVERKEDVITDLLAMKAILTVAQQAGTEFHVALDV